MADSKQKCLICMEEVSESDYRRELTCSYTSCPGSEHAYHEECINDYLRKLKLPADRLIGYPCPVVLDNGRPCTGRITSTHHKIPLNHKKKQKRVEAAAAAAAAPKPKPQPIPKPKQAVTGVAVATAAMGQKGVLMSAVKSGVPVVKVKNPAQAVPIGQGPAARLAGTALAVQNNSSTEPERVVRQRIIPGWTDPKELARSQNLEQQRAKAAALQAEARAAAGRGNKAAAVSANTSGFQPVASGPAPASNGGDRARAPPNAASARGHNRQQEARDDASGFESDESDADPFSRWRRSTDGTEDGQAPPEHNFNLVVEDFPAIPATASGSVGSVPPTPGKAASKQHSVSSRNMFAELEPGDDSDSGGRASAGGAGLGLPESASVPEAPAREPSSSPSDSGAVTPVPDNEDDPVVGHDQVFELPDGMRVIKDLYDQYYLLTDVYGENPELVGLPDDDGNVSLYVVVRASHVAAQQQDLSAAAGSESASGDGATPGDVTPRGDAPAPSPSPAPSQAQASMYDITSNATEAAAAAYSAQTQAALTDGLMVMTNGAPAAGNFQQVAQNAQMAAVEGHHLMVAAQAQDLGGYADDGGGDLDDILALCMGDGGAPAAPAPAAAPEVATQPASRVPEASMAAYGMTQPPSFYAAVPTQMLPVAQPPMFGTFYEGAYGMMPMAVHQPAAAPAGCGDVDQGDADDVNSLMQLLCV